MDSSRFVTYAALVLKLLIALILVVRTATAQRRPKEQEYCQDEQFEARCAHNEAIVVLAARYGRAWEGRCAQSGLGHVGCEADVTRWLAALCSGRQTCRLQVYQVELRSTAPCIADVSWHLYASYHCTAVEQFEGPCTTSVSAHLGSGLLSSAVSGAGHPSCPWVLEPASPGKSLRLTALNLLAPVTTQSRHSNVPVTTDVCYKFAKPASPGKSLRLTALNLLAPVTTQPRHSHVPVTTDFCYKFAKVVDGLEEHTLSLCSDSPNTSVVYTSQSPRLHLHFTPPTHSNATFLLAYSEVGCGTIPVTRGAHTELDSRQGIATVRCNASGETWFLSCSPGASQWRGRLGNCSVLPGMPPGSAHASAWSLLGASTKFPYGLVLVVATGVALGVFLGGTSLVLVSYRMNRKSPRYELPPDVPVQDYLTDNRRGGGGGGKPAPTPHSLPRHANYGGTHAAPTQGTYDSAQPINKYPPEDMPRQEQIMSGVLSSEVKIMNSKERKSTHLYDTPHMV